MPYNITHVEALNLDARMTAGDVIHLYASLESDLPGHNFLEDLHRKAVKEPAESSIELESFSWSSEWSGTTYESVLLGVIAPKVKGRVEAVFVWEGGDALTGVIIEDGKVTLCDVKQTLVPREKKDHG